MEQNQYDQQQNSPYTEFFSWGSDTYGQLALANSEDENQKQYNQKLKYYDQPKSLSFDIIIQQISCGDYHAAFISGDGYVFSVGRNSEGQLGIGDMKLQQSSAPLLVDYLTKIQSTPKHLSCGGSHTMIVMNNGELYSWGSSNYGQTGTGSLKNLYQPTQIIYNADKSHKFDYVDCGKKHSMIIDSYGKLYVCGDNQFRQLGIPHKDKIIDLTQLNTFQHKAKAVAAGIEHSLILTQDDKVFSAGNNNQGNLGLGHNYSSDNFLLVHELHQLQIKQIAAGRHSAIITQDGRLFIWGPAFIGQEPLLLPQELRSNKQMLSIAIGEKESVVIDQENQLYIWGNENNDPMPELVEALTQKIVTQVDIGLDFVIALGQDFNESGYPIEKSKQIFKEDNVFQRKEIKEIRFDCSNNTSQEYPKYQIEEEYQYNSKKPDYTTQREKIKNEQMNVNQVHGNNTDHSPISRQSQDRHVSKSPIQYSQQKFSSQPYENRTNTKEIANNISTISSNSNTKDPAFTYSHIAHQKDESYSAPQIPVTNKVQPYSGVTNADLYRQLDVAREESHQLKQKNRELMQMVNQLKQENETVITNAEQEIKRMSEFIDQFTSEVDSKKKDMESQYEQKLQIERRQNEELKLKMHNDQNELDQKLDRLQREIEKQRQENLFLQQEKTESSNQNRKLQEQLEISQQKLVQLQSQVDKFANERNMSPIQVNREPDNFRNNMNEINRSRSPINYNEKSQQQPYANTTKAMSNYNSNIRDFYEQRSVREEIQRPPTTYQSIQSQRETLTPVVGQKRIATQNYFSPTEQSSEKYQRDINFNRPPTVYQRKNESERKERNSPQRIANLLGIYSPIRENIAQQSLQPIDYVKYNQHNVENQLQEQCNNSRYHSKGDYYQKSIDHSQSQIERPSIMKSPLKTEIMEDAYSVHKKLQQQLNYPSYSPSLCNRREEKENTIQRNEIGGTALSEVKNRLAAMQKNKEELEEKLKTYEAKIRQHFNR